MHHIGWLTLQFDALDLIREPTEPFAPRGLTLLHSQVLLDATQLAVHRHDDATRQIDDELEGRERGFYAGAVGYLGFDGNMDTCIAIRTILFYRGKIILQAGAGIVADSDPAFEYEETLHKARALRRALELAAAGLNS